MRLEKQVIMQEAELIRRCLDNERKAQFILYQRYARQMLNVAYRILNNEEDAKDVLQDAFLKAFQQLKHLKNPEGFGGWLKRIVVNTAINLTKKKGRLFLEISESVLPPVHENFDEIDKGVFNLERAKQALMQLPNGYRTVLSLYLIEGYDHQEIAEILGISKSTSLTQYKRGKQKLRSLLTNDQKGKSF